MSSPADADLEGGRQTGFTICLNLSIWLICLYIDNGPLGLPLVMDVTSWCCRAKNMAYKEDNYGRH